MDASTYCAYFAAIRALLEAEYVTVEECQRSNYDYLQQHLPELTQAEYKHKHRCRFEYLAKLTRQELLHTLRKEW
ncbi:MAG: hypothetical protein ACREOO_28680 [bacterium]